MKKRFDKRLVKKLKNQKSKMQGFRNYNIEAMQRDQLHVVDLMPPQYGKSTPPMSPDSGKLKGVSERRQFVSDKK